MIAEQIVFDGFYFRVLIDENRYYFIVNDIVFYLGGSFRNNKNKMKQINNTDVFWMRITLQDLRSGREFIRANNFIVATPEGVLQLPDIAGKHRDKAIRLASGLLRKTKREVGYVSV
jgi:hypothetical protein